jgi:hypothetical protein
MHSPLASAFGMPPCEPNRAGCAHFNPSHCCSLSCPQGAYAAGDSLLRLLLNLPAVQGAVAVMLLEKLPEYSGLQVDAEAAGTGAPTSLPGLILGQLRWLEAVPEGSDLTAKVRCCRHTVWGKLPGLCYCTRKHVC